MNDNAKNVIFKAQNVAIYALYWGKLLKFGKCVCVKKIDKYYVCQVTTLTNLVDHLTS